MADPKNLKERLNRAVTARSSLVDANYTAALRLFAGFYEGFPGLAADVYGRTLVLHAFQQTRQEVGRLMATTQAHLLEKLPWIECVLQKHHSAPDENLRRGKITFGDAPSNRVREHGVWYATDLQINRDASFYLDTRGLRRWLIDNGEGQSILNLFAYTGALGVAALAGGAMRVVQVDRNPRFMALAQRSCQLNQLDSSKMELLGRDFFSAVAHFKKTGELFDQVIVDPPYQSTTVKGSVDLVHASTRVINKVRPLVADGGALVAINNALFLKGNDYLSGLEKLCQDGYLAIEKIIPVPADITGFPGTIVNPPPVDPAPFNHPTKIVVLRVRRK